MAAVEYIDSDAHGNEFDAHSFLNALDLANNCWWEPGDLSSQWVFRGHGEADWLLKPSAWRDMSMGNKLAPLVEKIKLLPLHRSITAPMKNAGIDSIDDSHPIYPWINAEIEALYQFSELGNQLGFNVEPMTLSPLHDQLIYTGTIFLINTVAKNRCLAQHHGVPTRLLDFTFDPMLAIFHAAMHSKNKVENVPDIAIWALNKRARYAPAYRLDNMSYQSIAFTLASASTNPYLKAQSGLFVSFPFAEEIFYKKKYWPCMEEYYKHSNSTTPVLKKYTLKSVHLPELRELFRRRGLSKAKLMPTLDNVAEAVIERW